VGRLGSGLRRRWWILPLLPVATWYVYESFLFPEPAARILLRTLPVLPFATWTIFFDASRPLKYASGLAGVLGRALLLAMTIAFAALVLGLGINWVYDPSHVA